jgi:hypothetical protein
VCVRGGITHTSAETTDDPSSHTIDSLGIGFELGSCDSSSVRSAVRTAGGSSVGAWLGSCDGSCVGASVDEIDMGSSVVVGKSVVVSSAGDSVGSALGVSVTTSLGAEVGDSNRTSDGSSVGTAAGACDGSKDCSVSPSTESLSIGLLEHCSV